MAAIIIVDRQHLWLIPIPATGKLPMWYSGNALLDLAAKCSFRRKWQQQQQQQQQQTAVAFPLLC